MATLDRLLTESMFLNQHVEKQFSIVQISDLHLFEHYESSIYGIKNELSFDLILTQIQNEFSDLDLVVVTGDLAHEPSAITYDRIFAKLSSLPCPVVCIAGNHDVTAELDPHLPFYQRRHLPIEPDCRFLDCQVIETQDWQLLFVNSSVAGKVHGYLTQDRLDWLAKTLKHSQKPCILFVHHPMYVVHSAWIDVHRLQNLDEFWHAVLPYKTQLKAIVLGHVHQETHVIYQGISLFSVPSTSVQFKPFCDDFCIDNEQKIGLRWLTLYKNGHLATGVKRIDTLQSAGCI